MFYTKEEVIRFVKDNDIKFVRLAFCDVFGVQKNVSIMPYELERAFDMGISFDASAIKGFASVEKSDLFLFPDPSTCQFLPWRSSNGSVVRFFCDIKYPDGTQFELDTRHLLKKAILEAAQKGVSCNFGSECEFYLFKTNEDGEDTEEPLDNGGYMDISPKDKGENIRREICLTLDEMGMRPESSHHEEGPGQNEITFKYSDALSSADNLVAFKSVVESVAEMNGLHAVFSPKPMKGKSGNGLHINMSPHKIREENTPQEFTDSFMAGVMRRIREISAFLNPSENSFERLGEKKAPKYITWAYGNRSQLIRIPAADGEYARIELRSPDPQANPYLAYALILYAGLEGVEDCLEPDKPVNENLFNAPSSLTKELDTLPESFNEAIELSSRSEFVKTRIPQSILDIYSSK